MAPFFLKKDLEIKTEMNTLNYMELQVLQQAFGSKGSPTLWK